MNDTNRTADTGHGDGARAAIASAARNNAEWCAAVCRSHGIPYETGEAAWWSVRRTPAYYPDAVTLRPDAVAEDILRRVDTSAGCSVKDSFATLDLTAHGFTPLLHGTWFHRPADPPGNPSGAPAGPRTVPGSRTTADVVRDAGRLAAWVSAWHGGSGTGSGAEGDSGRHIPAAPDVFRPTLLRDPAVRVLTVHRDGAPVGGAVLNLGAGLVGVTNVFTLGAPGTPSVWSAVVRAAADHFPGVPLVGYATESGPDAEADAGEPLPPGFRPLGALRVWLRTGA
ncbi:hypothetical protein [Streptomyces sp. NBC_01497]|uniref:hypothetical protein n=1 Tax=Streptomyces sp. NBC_01497 TaxID=2903885 RepID=UPI002E2F907B|nr:hypothetical protein [Streptomyces sp. NBC_01497]